MNVYYNPEKWGLERFGEIDWSDGNYIFDLTVVWRRTEDGTFFWAEDAGCSCYPPFDWYIDCEDLVKVESLAAFKRHLESRGTEHDLPRGLPGIVALIERMYEAGAR